MTKKEYAGAARRLKQQLGTLEFLRRTWQREELLAGASVQKGIAADKASPSTIIALGMQVQQESQQAVSRMTKTVAAAKQVGTKTLVEMERQHGQLARMRDTVGAQEAQYLHAEREIRTLAHDALSDYITQVLLALIAIALFFAITFRLSTSSSHLPGVSEQGWRRTVLSPLSTLPQ